MPERLPDSFASLALAYHSCCLPSSSLWTFLFSFAFSSFRLLLSAFLSTLLSTFFFSSSTACFFFHSAILTAVLYIHV